MKLEISSAHLAYCTNIHPAETWEETFDVLKTHTLTVRDQVLPALPPDTRPSNFAIGLRLSALAASQLLELDPDHQPHRLLEFKAWLKAEDCYVFTINGFPYGDFHGTRVKENVYRPDWTSAARLDYTNQLTIILAELLPDGIDGSISTLPGSFKPFEADELAIFTNLYHCASFMETMSQHSGKDIHLGLEPEPLGHFENTEETIVFFQRFHQWAKEIGFDTKVITQRIGVNYDTCHFALEFDDCHTSLDALRAEKIRISKIHLSSALTFDPNSPTALDAIRAFDEPTYLHQVIVQNTEGTLQRHIDLPEYFKSLQNSKFKIQTAHEARIHFHIPLYAEPDTPLASTRSHASDALSYLKKNINFCTQFEIETYTWAVLPTDLQVPIETQIAKEYKWVLDHF